MLKNVRQARKSKSFISNRCFKRFRGEKIQKAWPGQRIQLDVQRSIPGSIHRRETFIIITASVDKLTELTGSEFSALGTEREALHTKISARRVLRSDLAAIQRTARAIAVDVPG